MKDIAMSPDEIILRPKLELVDARQIESLVERGMHVLETTGVRSFTKTLWRCWAIMGRMWTARRFVFPTHLVQDAIASAPKRLTIYDRNGEPAMELGGPTPTDKTRTTAPAPICRAFMILIPVS